MMLKYLVLLLPFLLANVRSQTDKEVKSIRELSNDPGLSHLIRPLGNKGKNETRVKAQIVIEDILSVNYIDMTARVKILLKLFWKDPKFSYYNQTDSPSILFDGRYSFLIWKPDLFIENSRDVTHLHDMVYKTPDVVLRVFPNGTLFQLIRVATTLSCPMKMKKYPFDYHRCQIRLKSYGLTTEEVTYSWTYPESVYVEDGVDSPEFELTKAEAGNCEANAVLGSYPCLSINLDLKRRSWSVKTFILEGLILMSVSWPAFWFSSASMVSRFAYVMFCLGLECFFICKSNEYRPTVYYQTALDTWNYICLVTVLLEMMAMLLISHRTSVNTKHTSESTKSSFQEKCLTICNVNCIGGLILPVCYYIAVGAFFSNYF